MDVDTIVLDTATLSLASRVDWRGRGASFEPQLIVTPALPAGIGREAVTRLLESVEVTASIAHDEIHSIWVRRPRPGMLHPSITAKEFKRFAHLATRATVDALLARVRVHNRPETAQLLRSKIHQLAVAVRCGLSIPDTIVTSCPREAQEFVRACWGRGLQVIYKQPVAVRDSPPTRLFTEEDLGRLKSVQLAPSMLQERIIGGADIRVAIVADRIFAAEWRPEEGARDTVDIRLERDAKLWPVRLDKETEAALLRAQRAFGLSIGVYDLKMDDDGRPFFLEVNPSGQWLNLEVEAAYPLSETVARLLAFDVDGVGTPDQPVFTVADLEAIHATAEDLIRASGKSESIP